MTAQHHGGPSGHGGRGKRNPARLVAVGIGIVLVIIFIMSSCASNSSASSANCGDYDLRDGQYVLNSGAGDYEKSGDGYQYVGCDTSRSGGGIWFLPIFGGSGGSNYGDGSGFRGGGSGFGK